MKTSVLPGYFFALFFAVVVDGLAQLPPPMPGIPIGRCVRVIGVTAPEDAKTVGFEYVELALQDILPLAEQEFEQTVTRIRGLGIPAISGYGFLPADLKIVGPDVEQARVDEHLRRGLTRAARLGLKLVVFGNLNGQSRSAPAGFSRDEAWKQFVGFGQRAAREAKKHGLVALIEPMPPRSTNMINTVAEALNLIRAVRHPNFQMLVDYSFMAQGQEDMAILHEAGRHIRQVEISNPKGRVYPSSPDEADYASFFRALKRGGYKGGISIHGQPTDFFTDAPRAIALLRRLAHGAFEVSSAIQGGNVDFRSLRAAKRAIKIECVAGCSGSLDGSAKGVRLIEPFGAAFDKQGNWYICEYKGQRITKVDTKGMIAPFAGREGNSSELEGAMANQLKFNDPHGLVISKEQMYIADTLNHRVVKIDLKTGRAATIAGTGQAGYAGDGGLATKAAFNQLYAVDINRAGNKLYITDLRNRRIRLLDLKSGDVTTIAGNGQEGVPADGAVANDSPLVDPRAAAVDSKGNVYILERRGNALRVLDRQGKIRTVIGPESPPHSKTGREPDLNGPKNLCIDLRDNVIIADAENHLIRKYDPRDGTTTVIAGTGEKGDRLIADDPLKTQLNRPHGVFVHPSGALYISDSYNHRVLKLSGR